MTGTMRDLRVVWIRRMQNNILGRVGVFSAASSLLFALLLLLHWSRWRGGRSPILVRDHGIFYHLHALPTHGDGRLARFVALPWFHSLWPGFLGRTECNTSVHIGFRVEMPDIGLRRITRQFF